MDKSKPKRNMSKPKNSQDKKITLSEFRSWLEGVEAMNTRTWTPSSSQWRAIRKKIDQISEDTIITAQQQRRLPSEFPSSLLPDPAPVTRFPFEDPGASVIAAMKAKRMSADAAGLPAGDNTSPRLLEHTEPAAARGVVKIPGVYESSFG